MDFQTKQQLLNVVQAAVEGGSISLMDLMECATRGQEARYQKINHLRTEAEAAVVLLYDLVPASKHVKHVVTMTRAKGVLINSGSFAGSQMCKELEAEIGFER